MLLCLAWKAPRGDGSLWRLSVLLLAQNSQFLAGLCALGVTGVWLGLKQRSLTRASLSLVFYLLILPALLYFFWPTRPGLVTLLLVLAYGAIALLMRRALTHLVERADGLQGPLRRGE